MKSFHVLPVYVQISDKGAASVVCKNPDPGGSVHYTRKDAAPQQKGASRQFFIRHIRQFI